MGIKYTTARLSLSGERFEILVNPDYALDFKRGKNVTISQVLVVDTIFSDASKGMRASEETLLKVFKNSNFFEIAETILRRGQLQLTTEQRHNLIEEKRRQIVSVILKRCLDPRTGLPHPPIRVNQAMAQIHIQIDPFKDAEEQAKKIIGELKSIIPIRIEQIAIAVKIPPEYVPQSIGTVKNFGTIKQGEWQADGSWVAVIEIPAGLHAPFLEKLGKVTQGNLQTKTLR
jgi:ribosome maturation protein SDO1